MPLRDTSRSVDDLLYSLGTSLQRFKGENGLKRMFDAGKLSWLSFVGEFQETRDELFSRRTYSLSNTRKCLLTLNDLFEDVTRYATKMTEKVELITKTLDSFHRCCDLELENPEDTENTNYVVAEEKLREMRKLNSEIRSVLGDFCDSAATCKTLNAATVAQLEEVDKDTAGAVGKAQTDFDAQRRRLQVKEDELNRLRSVGARPGSDQLQFAEFNVEYEKESLQTAGDAYFIALQEAMTSTSFALEQTCMATWASSNVFFVQQGLFLREFEARVTTASRLLVDIKNSQTVSKQIGAERKAMLEALHPNELRISPAAAAAAAAASPAAPQTGDAARPHLDDLESLFGPPIASSTVPVTSAPPTHDTALTDAVGSPGDAAPESCSQPSTVSHTPIPTNSQPPQSHTWGRSYDDPSISITGGQAPLTAPQLPSTSSRVGQPFQVRDQPSSSQPSPQWTTQQTQPQYNGPSQSGFPHRQGNSSVPQPALHQSSQQGSYNRPEQSVLSGFQQLQQQQQRQDNELWAAGPALPPPAHQQQPSASSGFENLFQ